MKHYSEIIKEYRLKRNLSQKSLSNGICAQSIISKIEKNELTPSVELFFKIINKLEIPFDLFSEQFHTELNKKSTSTLNTPEISKLLENRDYVTLNLIINTLSTDNLSFSDSLYYKYLSGIIEFSYNKNIENSKIILSSLLEIVNINYYSDLYLHVLHAFVSIYIEEKDYYTAMKYLKKINHNLSICSEANYKTKFFYSYSLCLSYTNDTKKAIEYVNLAINNAVDNNSIYCLGDSLVLKSSILFDLELYEKSLEICNKSLLIFQINNNETMINYTIKLKKQIEAHLLRRY